jgi:hypothetical protein
MVEPLFPFLQLGVEHIHTIFPDIMVDKLAISAIIRETVSVILGNADIEHIGTIVAEFHFWNGMGVYGVLIQIVYACFPLQFLLLDFSQSDFNPFTAGHNNDKYRSHRK